MSSAKRSNESKWKQIVAKVKAGSKGGDPGEWSARKAQLATKQYKDSGGTYSGSKKSDNSLTKWTQQDWRTKSGKPSKETGERYLPAKAIKALSSSEYAETTAAKRKGTKAGKQFVAQPKAIAKKTAKYRR